MISTRNAGRTNWRISFARNMPPRVLFFFFPRTKQSERGNIISQRIPQTALWKVRKNRVGDEERFLQHPTAAWQSWRSVLLPDYGVKRARHMCTHGLRPCLPLSHDLERKHTRNKIQHCHASVNSCKQKATYVIYQECRRG